MGRLRGTLGRRAWVVALVALAACASASRGANDGTAPIDVADPGVAVDGWLKTYADLSGRPVLITEFSFRAADGGVPNSYPPIYPTLDTQQQRADAFAAYATASQQSPWIVGHHWFQYTDEPPGGRFDGEDSNFGLVDNADQPWAVLTARMTGIHAEAPHLKAP